MLGAGVQSFALGTLGLLVVLVISTIIASTKETPKSVTSFRSIVLITISFHALHLGEETVYGFHRLFPELLGLAAWPVWLFLSFNLSWIGVWLFGAFVVSPNRFTMTTFWFLALASTVNAIAHPTFSILVAGYFPGLISSPFVGVFGILLLRQLIRTSNIEELNATA